MKIFLFLILFLFVGVAYVVISQSYPVAFVGWQMISAKSFNNNFDTAVYYYEKVVQTYNKNASSSVDSPLTTQEIKRAVLDKSIENILILNELHKRVKSSELDLMVKNRIDEIFEGQDIAEQVMTLYNLSMEDFERQVLTPEARLEILQARLALENIDFDDWLATARKQAKVIILLSGFTWNGEGVVVK